MLIFIIFVHTRNSLFILYLINNKTSKDTLVNVHFAQRDRIIPVERITGAEGNLVRNTMFAVVNVYSTFV